MDFSNLREVKPAEFLPGNFQGSEVFQGYSRRMSDFSNEHYAKSVVIVYASGSMGANKELEIERGNMQKAMSQNFYLCELEHTKKAHPKLDYLITPVLETGIRIQYRVIELDYIDSSINLTLRDIAKIARTIYDNYKNSNAFIVVSGLDTICQMATTLSFMLENLNKLVVCTGGYLPLSLMRNDAVVNLLECFSLIAEASNLCDVVVVNKNKGFRANRCIKASEGDFENITSPNMPALCSIKTTIRARFSLFRPTPTQPFSIFTEFSNRVKVLRYNQFQCLESLQYELKNPYVKGYIIQSYSFANIPNIPELLELFKQAHEDPARRTIFINLSEAICSKNQSLMRQSLEQYHIFYGFDMTVDAALSKLSYLLGKGYDERQVIALMQSNLRGELTEEKRTLQFKMRELGMMQIVDTTIDHYFPLLLKKLFKAKMDNNVAKYIARDCSPEEFRDMFNNSSWGDRESRESIAAMANLNKLLHRAVEEQNTRLVQFLLGCGCEVNLEDSHSRSPMYYALKARCKSLTQLLSKNGGKVIALYLDLFEIFVEHLKKDDVEFFHLLFHIEFKETLGLIKNSEQRTVAHIAGLFRAQKCYDFIREKFKIPLNESDLYGKTPAHYLKGQTSDDQIQAF